MSEQEQGPLTAGEWWKWQFETLQLCQLRACFPREEISDSEFFDWWTEEQAKQFCDEYDRIRELLGQFPQEQQATALELAFRAFYQGRKTHRMIDQVRRRDGRKKGGKGREGHVDYPDAMKAILQLINDRELKRLKSKSSKASAIIKTLDHQKIERPGKRQIERWLTRLGQ